ncbi:MAG: exosortase K [Bacillota bacterium]
MNIIIYLISIMIVGGLHILYQYGSLETLLFMLKPVTLIVQWFLGTAFIYHREIGFVSSQYQINIGRACAGINFFVTVYLMLVFSFIQRMKDKKSKAWAAVLFLLSSYGITILANASRIIGAVFIMNTGVFLDEKQAKLMHQSIGIIFYVTFLMLAYVLFSKLINNWGDSRE